MRKAFLRQVAAALGVELQREAQVLGYQIDSRKVGEGDLFFALKGERVDGHRFLAEVAQKGAVGAVVSKDYEGEHEGMELIRVDDVVEALQSLGKWSVSQGKASILGVTGSVGKTTTKEFLASLLEGKFRVGKSPASYNSKVSFPLNLLNLDGDEEALVLEMGMSAPGEIAKLVEIAAPDKAIITKIGLAHAMNFPDGLEGIARAKAEIFSHEKTKTAIVDLEFAQYADVWREIRAEKVTFSLQDSAADYYLSFAEGRYRIDERGVRAHQFDLPFKESHLLQNFVAAIAAVRLCGMEWEEIEKRIPHLQLPSMRFQKFEKEGICFINDAYNANPASMKAALENLPEPKEGGKRIAVLATMKELGSFSEEAHAEVGRLAQKRADALICFGEEARPLCDAFQEARKPAAMAESHQSAADLLREMMRPGDVVLVKGSRSMEMEKILELLDASSCR